jgi:hypothetical protein
MRLALLMSQHSEPPRPQPSYASVVMLAGVSEDEAVRMAIK